MFFKCIVFCLVSYTSAVKAVPIVPRAGDFGSCSDLTIEFADGLDGRNEAAFAPNNEADFNHGSALNIGVISSFICGQLQSKCQADQTAISACAAAQSASSGLTGQAAADAFNAAITGGTSENAATPSSAALNSAATPSPTTASASGQNLQTFTGDLGGAPPAVVAGGKGFVVDGSDFVNLNAALGRSCDVQHNACANAANSGANFSVADCDAQDSQCRSAI